MSLNCNAPPVIQTKPPRPRRAASQTVRFRPRTAGPVHGAVRVGVGGSRELVPHVHGTLAGHQSAARHVARPGRHRVVDRYPGDRGAGRVRHLGGVGDGVSRVNGCRRRRHGDARGLRDSHAARGHEREVRGGEGLGRARAADGARADGLDPVPAQGPRRQHGRRAGGERDRDLLVQAHVAAELGARPREGGERTRARRVGGRSGDHGLVRAGDARRVRSHDVGPVGREIVGHGDSVHRVLLGVHLDREGRDRPRGRGDYLGGHRLVDGQDQRDEVGGRDRHVAEVEGVGARLRGVGVLAESHGERAGRPEVGSGEVAVGGVVDVLGLQAVQRVGLVDRAVIVEVHEDGRVVLGHAQEDAVVVAIGCHPGGGKSVRGPPEEVLRSRAASSAAGCRPIRRPAAPSRSWRPPRRRPTR